MKPTIERLCPYTAKATQLKEGWGYQLIEIFKEEEKIGEFKRNYGSFGISSFSPFYRDGEWYALCSPTYVALKVMKLPECEIIGGEKDHSCGFCPVETFIPTYQWDFEPAKTKEELKKYPKQNHKWLSRDRKSKEYDPELYEEDKDIFYEDFSFVSGCVWGDDSSWKVEMRDISKAHDGIIERIDIGYHELPWNHTLKDSILLHGSNGFCDEFKNRVYLSIATVQHLQYENGKVNPED